MLVHNSCHHNSTWDRERQNYWKNQSKIVPKGTDRGTYIATTENLKQMASGKAPIGWDGKSVMLHHNKGIAVDFYDYKEVNRIFHYGWIHAKH